MTLVPSEQGTRECGGRPAFCGKPAQVLWLQSGGVSPPWRVGVGHPLSERSRGSETRRFSGVGPARGDHTSFRAAGKRDPGHLGTLGQGCGDSVSYVDRLPSKGEQVPCREDETCFTVTFRTEQMDGPESRHQRHGCLGRNARVEFDVINHHNLLQFPKTNMTGWNYFAVLRQSFAEAIKCQYKSEDEIYLIRASGARCRLGLLCLPRTRTHGYGRAVQRSLHCPA